jgi:hypothetical protein
MVGDTGIEPVATTSGRKIRLNLSEPVPERPVLEMGIASRHRRRRVAEQLTNDRKRGTTAHKETRKRMPQIMQPDTIERGGIPHALPCPRDSAKTARPTIRGEDPGATPDSVPATQQSQR